MSIITASTLPLSNTALKHITSVLPNEGKNDHLPWLERTNKWGCVDKISNFISFYERKLMSLMRKGTCCSRT